MDKKRKSRIGTYLLLAAYFLISAGMLFWMYAIAFGETTDPATGAPEFPFKNLAQTEVGGLPGVKAEVRNETLPCFGHELVMARYRDATGEIIWQVFVQVGGPNITGAYYGDSKHSPRFVYFATLNPINGHITVNQVEPFDPTIHIAPCDRWGTRT